MNQSNHRIQFWIRILSYITVAAAASALTLVLFCRSSKLDQIQKLIETRFVGEKNITVVEDAAARAMIAALDDRWSYYISAADYAAFQEKKTNSYVGIGITILAREDGIGFDILAVTPGGSAEKAGILPGDILVAADGQSVAGTDSSVPSNIIRGKAGTMVSVTVLREGEERTFSVKRQRVETAVAEGKLLEGNVGYVRIVNFNDRCAEQTIAAVEELLEQGAEKLVFDVRNNSGGYIHEMVAVLDYLLPEGELIRSVDTDGRESLETSDAQCLEMPMAVLVNARSYSAAEFFAAALREYEWAAVVGEPTSGKGYYQTVFRLSDGSAVGLSIGQYFTPNGICLADVGGLIPDVEVPVDAQMDMLIQALALAPEEDPQYQTAVAVLP